MCAAKLIVSVVALFVFGGAVVASDDEIGVTPEIRVALPVELPNLGGRDMYEGEVLVGFFVDQFGKVSEVSVLESSQPGVWEDQAIQRVRNLRFHEREPGYREVVVRFVGY